MRFIALVVVSIVMFGSTTPSVTGQEATPASSSAAGECGLSSVDSQTAAILASTPGSGEGGTAAEVDPGSEAPLPARTPPPGTTAGANVLERIRAAEENLKNCFVAGDYEGFTALFTPRALLEELGVSDPRATPVHSASFLILREEVLSVTDAQTHADGRVSADVTFSFEGQPMRARDIFVEVDGRLLLDEIFELGLDSTPTATRVPVAGAMLDRLTIMGFPPGEEPGIVATIGSGIPLQPGDVTDLVLGVFDYEVCGTGIRCFMPVDVIATWSIAPSDGAHIDPTTGVLTIDAGTPSGSDYVARAEVESGRHVVETQVNVYTPDANPLVGYWREAAQLTCDDATEVVPEVAIEELIFFADGTFAVTWMPFESYQDYWGTYTFDLSKGTLELAVTGGNYIPPDVDGEGRFALTETGLALSDMWLGAPSVATQQAGCGHRFGG